MKDSVCVENVSDVKITWAVVMNNGPLARANWSRKREFPAFDVLKQNLGGEHDPSLDVVIRRDNPEELREMRAWLEENARRGYTIHGRFKWSDSGFAVKRALDGLLFKFKDPNVAFFFKMRWYNAPVAFG